MAGRLTYESLGFTAGYQCEPLERVPPDHATVYHYPEGADSEDLVLAVDPKDGARWIAAFAKDLDYPDGFYGYPNSDDFCANAGGFGYIVSSNRPRDYRAIEVHPLIHVFGLPTLGLIIFGDFTRLHAYGPSRKPVWVSEELSDDGLRISQVDLGRVRGSGWSAPWQQWYDFELDPHDGRVLASARPH
jgi:hypothetical protein